MIDTVPDLEVIHHGQVFPLYRYEIPSEDETKETLNLEIPTISTRVVNLLPESQTQFCEHYNDNSITVEDVFYYVYGMLHSLEYRERYSNDLSKEFPRIPLASNFRIFEEAGRELGKLHVGYESCPRYNLEVTPAPTAGNAKRFRFVRSKMRWTDKTKRDVLLLGDSVRIAGIPQGAHEYQVNGRTPIEWYIDRYMIKTDKKTGIVNDPNAWFEKPADFIEQLERLVHLSVETVRIVESLPSPFETQSR